MSNAYIESTSRKEKSEAVFQRWRFKSRGDGVKSGVEGAGAVGGGREGSGCNV